MVNTTSGLKNVNLLTKAQYDAIADLASDELYAVSGSGIGFPSSDYEDLTIGASGAAYTAPANGWFTIGIVGRAGSTYAELVDSLSGNGSCTSYSGGWGRACLPIRKGIPVQVYYWGSDFKVFRFIYAEGEE